MNTDLIRINKEYYQKLLQVYQDCKVVQSNNHSSKFTDLCTKIILRSLENNQNIIFQIPESFHKMPDLCCSFYINLTNYGFVKFVNYPDFKIGDRLKRRKKHEKEKEREFVIENIDGDSFTLTEKPKSRTKKETANSPVTIRDITYESLVKDYIKISDRTRSRRIESYFDLFKALNPDEDFDFIPTSFDKKIVFIGSKKTWNDLGSYYFNSFNIKNCIPAIYIPDPRDDSNPRPQQPTVKIDQPLAYFATRYETCYNQLLTRNVIVDLIMLLDADTASIGQILIEVG
ncbi:MAG: hypothetical protein AB1325_07350 [Nitrospirota bacterium]